jgi:hypothetical protein
MEPKNTVMNANSNLTDCAQERDVKQRTLRMNRAFHLWLSLSAQALRDGGFTLKQILESIPEVEMTPVAMKEIWRQIQVTMTGKTSTVELTTKELQEVWEIVNREILLKRGIVIPFPSSDPQIYNPEDYGH